MMSAENNTDWNNISLRMIPVLIVALIAIMYLFNLNSDKIGFVFLPHHFLLVMITIGILVVLAFAIYILCSMGESGDYSEIYKDYS